MVSRGSRVAQTPTDKGGGLRERKKRDTRRALSLAALELVEARGYDAVTTEEIAVRAGVSARTFFNYFPSKETALIGTTAEEIEAYAAQVETVVPGERPLTALQSVLTSMIAPASIEPALRAKRRRVLLGEPSLAPALVANNSRLENALTAALERRLGQRAGGSIEPRVMAAAAVAVFRACVEHQQNGGQGHIEANLEAAFGMLAAGLR